MCGIFGMHGDIDRQEFKRTLDIIHHRGPDETNFYFNDEKKVSLGHKRLSIIDINKGSQPMWSFDKSICVIFNGEIYNHFEIRRSLEKKGYKFYSDHSDTEILIYGYMEWGESLPQKLNGMFAFAIFDERKNLFFLSRDRFGEKPLYWSFHNERFFFGSELSLFASSKEFKTQIDILSLKKFFVYNFVPSPRTIYKNINKLQSGYFLIYHLSSKQIKTKKYWEYRIQSYTHFRNENEIKEELSLKLRNSVKRRLMSDVPLGVFLSGGLDSSIVAVCATDLLKKKIETFSIGFETESFDESYYAKLVSNLIGSNHNINYLSEVKILESIEPLLSMLDEPNGDPSFIPTYFVSKLASEKVKVTLTGDGGDELFAGYDTFSALKYANFFEKIIPKFMLKGSITLLDLFSKSNKNMTLEFKLIRALSGLGDGQKLWNPKWLSSLSLNDLQELFNEKLEVNELYDESIKHWDSSKSKDLVDMTSEFYVKFYLQDGVLAKVDRASMLNSIETRAIFLDNDIVDLAQKVPSNFKIRSGQRKYILKKTFENKLPNEIVNRKKKGFGIPLRKLTKKIKFDFGKKYSVINMGIVKHFYDSHKKNRDYRNFLWNMAVLQNFNFFK